MVFPSITNGMDRVLKEHFDRFMERGEIPPEIREHCNNHGYDLFKDKELLKIWRNVSKGLQYKDENSGVLVKGAIDNLLVKNGKLVVIDYKTRGFPVKEDSHEYYQAQMDIYAFLLKHNGYDVENYAYLLFYHPEKVLETGEFVFNMEMKRIGVSPEKGKMLIDKAIKILNGPMPEPSEGCKFCEWVEKVKDSERCYI